MEQYSDESSLQLVSIDAAAPIESSRDGIHYIDLGLKLSGLVREADYVLAPFYVGHYINCLLGTLVAAYVFAMFATVLPRNLVNNLQVGRYCAMLLFFVARTVGPAHSGEVGLGQINE